MWISFIFTDVCGNFHGIRSEPCSLLPLIVRLWKPRFKLNMKRLEKNTNAPLAVLSHYSKVFIFKAKIACLDRYYALNVAPSRAPEQKSYCVNLLVAVIIDITLRRV